MRCSFPYTNLGWRKSKHLKRFPLDSLRGRGTKTRGVLGKFRGLGPKTRGGRGPPAPPAADPLKVTITAIEGLHLWTVVATYREIANIFSPKYCEMF